MRAFLHRDTLLSALGTTLGVALLASAATPLLRASPPQKEDYRRTGALEAWQVDMDGTLYIRITPSTVDAAAPAGGKEEVDVERFRWFRTPPDKALQRNIEESLVVLLAANDVASGRRPITVTAKIERSLDGKTPETAIPLISVASP